MGPDSGTGLGYRGADRKAGFLQAPAHAGYPWRQPERMEPELIMKADLYTKAILTIIAASLAIIAGRGFASPSAAADDGLTKVVICDLKGRCAGVKPEPRFPNYGALLTARDE